MLLYRYEPKTGWQRARQYIFTEPKKRFVEKVSVKNAKSFTYSGFETPGGLSDGSGKAQALTVGKAPEHHLNQCFWRFGQISKVKNIGKK